METNSSIQFDTDQMTEIQEGHAEGLDVSFYAKKEFMAIQMHEIRTGLRKGLDVTQYADPAYDWFQMEEIRKGMEAGINYKLYASPKVEYKKMRQIRKGLEQGIDLSNFVKLEAGILRELRKAVSGKINIIEYIKEGYNVEQLEEIRYALEKKLPIRQYLSMEFRGPSIREICKGLEMGLDPSVYASIEYDWRQMREIRLGMENRVDISLYADSLFSWRQMREIRLGLEEGIDVTSYRRFLYTANDMEKKRKQISEGLLENALEDTKTEKLELSKFAVYISIDEMEACIEIKCDKNESVSSQEIREALRANGIVKGILDEEIERLAEERRYGRAVVVAMGKPAEKGEDGWYEYFFRTEINRSPNILEDGSADYKHIKWYEVVEPGQKLAFYHEAAYGTDGYTVTGKVLNAKKGKEKSILAGKGFMLMPDQKTYVATLKGKIDLLKDKRIEVTHLWVLEEVNAATGDVYFDGCIYIRGNVGSGAVISATEDVIINGSVEAAYIRCGGEVLLRQGMNGGGEGEIQAAGKVTGKFFESVKVVSGSDIQANYCLNCDLQAKGMIVIDGRKGQIAGGTANAVKGIRSYNVGNRARISTVLKMGVDHIVMKNKSDTEKMIAEVNKELAILGNAYIDFQRKYPPEVRNTMDMYLKIENAIYTKELQLDQLHQKKKELEDSMEDDLGSKAVIAGTLYEGTTVIIDNHKWEAFTVQDVTVRRSNDKIVAYAN